ncbi:MAG: recombinase RecF, partial [Hyphomicrobiales bacterium]
MTSAYHDYQQFLGWLYQPGRGAPEDVLRFANMTLAHFAAVAATTNRQSQRSTKLAALARAGLNQASLAPPPPGAALAAGAWAWSSLSSLTIGPFRGFRSVETFNFQHRI